MKKYSKALFALGVIIAVIVVVWCIDFNKQTTSENGSAIRIGAVLPLTGAGSVAGTYVQQALLFAQSLLSQEGRTQYDVVVEDSKSNPKDAILAYRKLLSDKTIKIVFLQMSSVIQTLIPLSENDDVLFVGIGSIEPNVSLDKPRQYIINYLDASTQAKIFLSNSKERILLFYLNDDYGMSIKEAMERQADSYGIQVKAYPFAISSHAQDVVATIPLSDNDSVVIAGYGPVMVDIAERLLQRGFHGNILCTPELLVNANLSRLKDVGEKLFVITMPMLSGSIEQQFCNTYNRNASVADMLSFNGLICISEAIEKINETNSFSAKQLLDTLCHLTNFDNAIGVSHITEHCFVYDAYIDKVFGDE